MYKVKLFIFELDIHVANCEKPSVKHAQTWQYIKYTI